MILCCGEALIDMIPEPTVSGGEGFVAHTGGAVFNTAIALGRLGNTTGMLTGLSTDMFGQQLSADLARAHVDASHVITSGRPTTLAFVELHNGQASYTFNDENSAGRMLTPSEMPKLSSDVTALFFGGISLACEPGADAYAAVLKQESGNRIVMMDPNIRPGFIQDETRYRARLSGMVSAADILKVSDEDLDWIIPGDASQQQKVQSLLDQGPALVIVTQGGDGATGYHKGGSVLVPSEKVDVIDTVGAGDTFNAGVLSALERNTLLSPETFADISAQDITDALTFGAKVAAVTVSRRGANPPWANEL